MPRYKQKKSVKNRLVVQEDGVVLFTASDKIKFGFLLLVSLLGMFTVFHYQGAGSGAGNETAQAGSDGVLSGREGVAGTGDSSDPGSGDPVTQSRVEDASDGPDTARVQIRVITPGEEPDLRIPTQGVEESRAERSPDNDGSGSGNTENATEGKTPGDDNPTSTAGISTDDPDLGDSKTDRQQQSGDLIAQLRDQSGTIAAKTASQAGALGQQVLGIAVERGSAAAQTGVDYISALIYEQTVGRAIRQIFSSLPEEEKEMVKEEVLRELTTTPVPETATKQAP